LIELVVAEDESATADRFLDDLDMVSSTLLIVEAGFRRWMSC